LSEPRRLAVCIRHAGNDLVAAECANLTGGAPDEHGLALCDDLSLVARSAYVRTGADVIASAETLDALVEGVCAADFDATAFRIECVRTTDRFDISSLDAIIAVADGMRGFFPDLDDPEHRFLLAIRDDGFWFGEIVTEFTRAYRRHHDKPFQTSNALPPRLARALVNIVSPPARVILDPCCGSGSIPMEAADMALTAIARDRSAVAVGKARGNLAHFGHAVDVEQADARHSLPRADAVITDLPYGIQLDYAENEAREILASCAQAAPVGVFVTKDDITPMLVDAGWTDVETFRHRKWTRYTKGFERTVHRARSGVVGPP
jgi:tRNA (guanine10-N2)-dimethyltransferase